MVASYYKKKPFNRITEELTFIRSRDNLSPNNLLFIIFKEILKAAVLRFDRNFAIITCPPTKYNSIKEIIKVTALELDISYVPINKFIKYDEKLHEKRKIRDIQNSDKAIDLVRKIYRSNNENYSEIKRLLIIDDIIRTGATLNRISYILKTQGVKSVYGFAWLRAIGSN